MNENEQKYLDKRKNPTIAFILSFFFGVFGVDRLYIGHVLYGMVKLSVSIFIFLLTFIGIGLFLYPVVFIMWLLDLFFIMKATARKNEKIRRRLKV